MQNFAQKICANQFSGSLICVSEIQIFVYGDQADCGTETAPMLVNFQLWIPA